MPDSPPTGEPESPGARRILRLPEDLANQIAAGEVVERPASAVKELVENAVDAGARRITVELEDGGLTLLRVIDDGCGMSPEDAALCIERHATSKLASAADLFAIRTLGFRGEALPSIASVSRFELLTKPHGVLGGTRISVEGGVVRAIEQAGAPPGTSVTVRDLFYNTPARLKFLKTRSTELKQVQEAVLRVALAHPEVAFTVSHNRRTLLELPAGEGLVDRIFLVFGEEDSELLHPMTEAEQDGTRAHGYFGQPRLTRRTTSGLWTFVNGRFVRDRSIQAAIRVAYQGLIDRGRHPVVILFVETPPETVDVNVHPMKTEVRFHEAGSVFRAVRRALHQSLAAAPWVPEAQAPSATDIAEPGLQPAPATDNNGPPEMWAGGHSARDRAPALPTDLSASRLPFRGEGMRTYRLDRTAAPRESAAHPRRAEPEHLPAPPPQAAPPGAPPHAAAPAMSPNRPAGTDAPRHFFSSLHYIGAFRGTYLLATDGTGLVIVDQHAAHERITYEDLRSAWTERAVERQPLLIPQRIRLDSLRAGVLADNLPFFDQVGFEIEPFGGTDFALKAVPALLARARHEALLRDALDELGETGESTRLEEARDAILSRMACHGSVRAGDVLSREQVDALFARMDRIDFGGNCPHGRPVWFRMALEEIEQRFDRR